MTSIRGSKADETREAAAGLDTTRDNNALWGRIWPDTDDSGETVITVTSHPRFKLYNVFMA